MRVRNDKRTGKTTYFCDVDNLDKEIVKAESELKNLESTFSRYEWRYKRIEADYHRRKNRMETLRNFINDAKRELTNKGDVSDESQN